MATGKAYVGPLPKGRNLEALHQQWWHHIKSNNNKNNMLPVMKTHQQNKSIVLKFEVYMYLKQYLRRRYETRILTLRHKITITQSVDAT